MRAAGVNTWGSRTQISATAKELDDLEGNRDGLWDNEEAAAGRVANTFARHSLAVRVRALAAAGLSTREQVERLKRFLARVEQKWGQPAVTPGARAQLRGADLFAAQKAIALERMGRAPDSVIDSFVAADGSLNGERIQPRKIFTQHFRPTAHPSGNVVVVAPGYLETGRNFYEQVVLWNAAGHDVLVMDQQWAGQSEGAPGTVDRGFGIMRDVAAAAVHAARIGEASYGVPARLALYGNSMGGLGVVGAYLLDRAKLVSLSGGAMPKDVTVVSQATYLGATPTLRNLGLEALARVPLLGRMRLPVVEGLPQLSSDPRAQQMIGQGAALEDVMAQPATFAAVQADIAFLGELVKREPPPPGAITMLHAERDPLASLAEVRRFVEAAGAERVKLVTVPSRDHVLEQSPSQLHHAVDAVNAVLAAG